jgi:hypothetical protein
LYQLIHLFPKWASIHDSLQRVPISSPRQDRSTNPGFNSYKGSHQEVSHEEIAMEEKIKSSPWRRRLSLLEEEGVETKFFWGSTLYHPEDLPSNYGGFREGKGCRPGGPAASGRAA